MSIKRSIFKGIAILFSVSFITLIVLILRPITTLYIDDCIEVTGTVNYIKAYDKSKDIHIRIGDGGRYYINQGLERGLTEIDLISTIMSKEVTIHYADHWTPLDPKRIGRHVARVTYGEEVLYDEIKE